VLLALALMIAIIASIGPGAISPASARTVTDQRPLLFSFNGEDTTAGKFAGVREITIDEASGDVYVLSVAGTGQTPGGTQEASKRVVDKFNYKGEAQHFAWTGTSSLSGSETPAEAFGVEGFFEKESAFTDVGVDDSCAVHDPPLSGSACASFDPANGSLYVQEEAGPLHIFSSEGRYRCTLPRSTVEPRGFAIDASGHVWLTDWKDRKAHEFANTGCTPAPPAQIGEFSLPEGNGLPTRIAVDAQGDDLYVADCCFSAIVEKYVAGGPDSLLTTMPTRDLTIDQSSSVGHIFAIGESKFKEYEPCATSGCVDNEVAGSPFGGDLIGDGRGIAYSVAKDWVYVSDLSSDSVKVFGPVASGIAPDVTSQATDGITETEATAHGTIDPQNVPNTYHFEWIRGEAQHVSVEAAGGTFRLSTGGVSPTFSAEMPFDVSTAALQAELEALYGAGNASVKGTPASGGAPGEYIVVFEKDLAGHDVSEMGGDASGLTGGAPRVGIRTVTQGQSWGVAEPQPTLPEENARIEPTDSSDHPVSLRLTGLRRNTTYDVRLVGTNTEAEGDPQKRLDAYSTPNTFTTLPPPEPTISEPGLLISDITAESAHVAATVDPQEDETVWQILTSTEAKAGASQAECEGLGPLAFEVAKEATIPFGEPVTVDIETELAGLEHSQTYCVRLIVTNGGGSARADGLFTTKAVMPTDVKLAFAAPRTDTSARLNAYVNPEGETPFTYRFEYSVDGTNWTLLKEAVSKVEAHRQIVVAEEAMDLTPNTTYHYRLGLVRNEAEPGEVPPEVLPAPKTFTTRTTAEMSLPSNAFGEPEKRGIELVNNPDKGNQNARAAELYSGMSPLRGDGEAFLWTVVGGAPGANSGTQATFLATRTVAGWVSRSLVPPASLQVGGGSLTYYPVAARPDFSGFIFQPALPSALTTGPPTYVRLDQSADQQILHSYESPVLFRVDATTDTAHVLIVDPDTGKLEDIGSGSAEEIDLIPPPTAPLGVPRAGGSRPACGLEPEGSSFFGPGGGGGAASQFQFGYHRMSITDASRVYFQVHPDSTYPSCNGPWALYERNREANPQTTTPIVSPALATNDTAIIRTTPDGHGAYFVTSAKLSSADKNSDIDVYQWAEATGKDTCLTCGVENEVGQKITDADLSAFNNGPLPVLVSDDFSHIYFNSTERLIPHVGVQGQLNLYVLSAGKVRFVASSVSASQSMQLSSDGNVLSFRSGVPLTADMIAPQCPVLGEGNGSQTGACNELFLYDDRGGSIECVSCRDGAATVSSVSLSSFGKPFQTSADGSTVSFTTAESLVPLDVNSSPDLYEWRNGSIRLITDGVTRYPIGLAAPIPQAVDSNGSNIAFSVASSALTGFERDGLANLYDARIGGGFTPPSPVEHCSEESCQGPLQAAPPSPQPGSAAYKGRGNVPPPRPCRPNKARRHSKCARRHSHKHKKHHHRRPARKGETK